MAGPYHHCLSNRLLTHILKTPIQLHLSQMMSQNRRNLISNLLPIHQRRALVKLRLMDLLKRPLKLPRKSLQKSLQLSLQLRLKLSLPRINLLQILHLSRIQNLKLPPKNQQQTHQPKSLKLQPSLLSL